MVTMTALPQLTSAHMRNNSRVTDNSPQHCWISGLTNRVYGVVQEVDAPAGFACFLVLQASKRKTKGVMELARRLGLQFSETDKVGLLSICGHLSLLRGCFSPNVMWGRRYGAAIYVFGLARGVEAKGFLLFDDSAVFNQ